MTVIKYLGFVISASASNVENVIITTNKSMGTIQNGLNYFNSLIRSSILFAGETNYNLTERKLRMLEGIEEDCLHKIFKTGRNCIGSLLYLETGVSPACFQI